MMNLIHSPEVGSLYCFSFLPAGKLLLVDAKEINSFTTKLLFYSFVTNLTFEDILSIDHFWGKYYKLV